MQNFLKIGWSSATILHIFDCQDGGHPTSLISKFWTFCKKFKLALNSMPVYKISSRGMIGCQVMASYRFSVRRLSAIFDWWKLMFFLVKIGGFAGKLWCIFDFQTAVRPPSWIWCDVISDHARCLFNGPNMLKKFDVDWLYSMSSFLYSAILASKWPVQAP